MEKNKKNINIKNKNVFQKIKKFLLMIFFIVIVFLLLFFIFINIPVKNTNNNARLGVTFSLRYASDIGLDWKKVYIAMLDEVGVKNIRIPIYWDLVEKNSGEYNFSDIDWQLEEASKRGTKVILVMGKKVPRWPECFVPEWIGNDEKILQEKLLNFENIIINKYKNNHPEIYAWQIENEPFLNFGICGTVPISLLDSEIAQAKKIDPSRPIVITDSGELSLWVPAAKRADIFGTTMYREVYSGREFFGKPLGHWRYPIGPNFFKLKKLFIEIFANQKNAIVIELQGEPWVQGWTTSAPVETQLASMNADILRDNVEFAKKTDMKEIYIWGVEWWYWMKEAQGNASLWEQAKEIFNK